MVIMTMRWVRLVTMVIMTMGWVRLVTMVIMTMRWVILVTMVIMTKRWVILVTMMIMTKRSVILVTMMLMMGWVSCSWCTPARSVHVYNYTSHQSTVRQRHRKIYTHHLQTLVHCTADWYIRALESLRLAHTGTVATEIRTYRYRSH